MGPTPNNLLAARTWPAGLLRTTPDDWPPSENTLTTEGRAIGITVSKRGVGVGVGVEVGVGDGVGVAVGKGAGVAVGVAVGVGEGVAVGVGAGTSVAVGADTVVGVAVGSGLVQAASIIR